MHAEPVDFGAVLVLQGKSGRLIGRVFGVEYGFSVFREGTRQFAFIVLESLLGNGEIEFTRQGADQVKCVLETHRKALFMCGTSNVPVELDLVCLR